MHPIYDSKGKVTKTVEQMRREFDRAMLPPTSIVDGGVPSWWGGDDAAASSSIAAARALGLKVPGLGT